MTEMYIRMLVSTCCFTLSPHLWEVRPTYLVSYPHEKFRNNQTFLCGRHAMLLNGWQNFPSAKNQSRVSSEKLSNGLCDLQIARKLSRIFLLKTATLRTLFRLTKSTDRKSACLLWNAVALQCFQRQCFSRKYVFLFHRKTRFSNQPNNRTVLIETMKSL